MNIAQEIELEVEKLREYIKYGPKKEAPFSRFLKWIKKIIKG